MIGALTRVSCGDCLGDGYAIINAGEWGEEYAACESCGGFGDTEVCSECGAAPNENDECLCNARCEFCDTPHPADQMIWGSCLVCFDAAYTRYADEMGEAAVNGYGRAA